MHTSFFTKIWHSNCWRDLENEVKITDIFPMTQWCLCVSLVKIHHSVQEIGCRQGTFLVFKVWWPWKLGQGHQNLIRSLNYPSNNVWTLARICHLVQEIGCRQAFFWSKFENNKVLVWPWKWGQGHQNLIISPPRPPPLPTRPSPIFCPCKFGQNRPTGSADRVQIRWIRTKSNVPPPLQLGVT